MASELLAPDLCEQPVGAEDQDEDQHCIRRDLRVPGRDVPGGEGFHQADDQSAQQRARE